MRACADRSVECMVCLCGVNGEFAYYCTCGRHGARVPPEADDKRVVETLRQATKMDQDKYVAMHMECAFRQAHANAIRGTLNLACLFDDRLKVPCDPQELMDRIDQLASCAPPW